VGKKKKKEIPVDAGNEIGRCYSYHDDSDAISSVKCPQNRDRMNVFD
jgi:hypothetical protein